MIEILVALMIVGGLIALVPRMVSGPDPLRQAWTLMHTISTRTRLESLTQGVTHRILIQAPDQGPLRVSIQRADSVNPESYQMVDAAYAQVTLPPDIMITTCVIDGVDEMQGGALTSCWIFVYADGTAQRSTLTLTDLQTRRAQTHTLNPLYGIWQ